MTDADVAAFDAAYEARHGLAAEIERVARLIRLGVPMTDKLALWRREAQRQEPFFSDRWIQANPTTYMGVDLSSRRDQTVLSIWNPTGLNWTHRHFPIGEPDWSAVYGLEGLGVIDD